MSESEREKDRGEGVRGRERRERKGMNGVTPKLSLNMIEYKERESPDPVGLTPRTWYQPPSTGCNFFSYLSWQIRLPIVPAYISQLGKILPKP